jgi:type IV pilus assembly protein PilV
MRCSKLSISERKNEAGLTLIEVMISLAIFSIGILAVAQLQIWNVKNNTTANISTQATLLARAKLEDLKNMPFTHAKLGIGTHNDANNPIDIQGTSGGIFNRQWTVTGFAGDPANWRQVDMTVSWNRLGQNRQIDLTTIIKRD